MDEHALKELVRAALEEAGFAGLCAEGRAELARDRLAAAAPERAGSERERLLHEVLAQAAPP